jgi:hypothetical protein
VIRRRSLERALADAVRSVNAVRVGEGVVCRDHGLRTGAVICTHLLDALRAGTILDGPWIVQTPEPDEPEPAAWCLDCDRLLDAEGGWTERFGEFSDLRRICGECFSPLLVGIPAI